jgi:hypothetical protein
MKLIKSSWLAPGFLFSSEKEIKKIEEEEKKKVGTLHVVCLAVFAWLIHIDT